MNIPDGQHMSSYVKLYETGREFNRHRFLGLLDGICVRHKNDDISLYVSLPTYQEISKNFWSLEANGPKHPFREINSISAHTASTDRLIVYPNGYGKVEIKVYNQVIPDNFMIGHKDVKAGD